MALPFEELLAEIVQGEVDFILVGGFAVNAHGHNRNTHDLDVIVRFDLTNVQRLVGRLKAKGFSPRMPVDPLGLADAQVRASWQTRNMVVLAFVEGKAPYSTVDVFIDHPIDYDRLVADSVRFVYSGVSVRVSGVAHLIQMKERAARPKDLLDLKFLYAILDQQKEGPR